MFFDKINTSFYNIKIYLFFYIYKYETNLSHVNAEKALAVSEARDTSGRAAIGEESTSEWKL